MDKDQITELYDKEGNLVGALLTAQAWTELKPKLGDSWADTTQGPAANPEPIEDWETLKTYWDFPYPVDMDVTCAQCGNTTEDWSEDTPRRFKLTAAGLSGLVTFACLSCQSKIQKKHFKDEIVVETYPPQDKDPHKEAKY